MPPVSVRRLWRPAGLAVISALLPVHTVAAEQRVGVFLVLLAACDPSADRPCTWWWASSEIPREACDFSPHFAAVGCAGSPQVLMPPEIVGFVICDSVPLSPGDLWGR